MIIIMCGQARRERSELSLINWEGKDIGFGEIEVLEIEMIYMIKPKSNCRNCERITENRDDKN